MVLLHRSLSLFSGCQCVGFHEFVGPLLDFHTNMHYLYRGTKGRSNHFSTSGHVLFSWLKQHVFFLIERCCATMSLLCRSNSKSMKAAEHRIRSHRKIHFYTLGVKQRRQKEGWAIYAGGLASVISLNNIRHRLCPLASQQHTCGSTCTPSLHEKLYLSILYSHTEPPNLQSINIYFKKVRARCQPGFKQLIDQLPIIKRAHLPSSGRTA